MEAFNAIILKLKIEKRKKPSKKFIYLFVRKENLFFEKIYEDGALINPAYVNKNLKKIGKKDNSFLNYVLTLLKDKEINTLTIKTQNVKSNILLLNNVERSKSTDRIWVSL